MNDDSRAEIVTRYGRASLIGGPAAGQSLRPVVIAIGGPLASAPQISALQAALGLYGDVAVLPLNQVRGAGDLHVESLAALLDEVIAKQFPGRAIVLFGTAIAATVALGARSPQVSRIVAVEPILKLAANSPMVPYLRRAVTSQAEPGPLVAALFGVTPAHQEARDYTALAETIIVPTHLLLGARLAGRGMPSLVGADERRLLGAHPRVSLQVAGDMGHEALGPWGGFVLELLREACRRAAQAHAYDIRQIDEVLLDATPLDARRLAYWGPQPEAFRAALAARCPETNIAALDDPLLDTLVLGALPAHGDLAALLDRISPGADIIARLRLNDPDQPPPRLAELGLSARRHPGAGASAVSRLSREAAALAPPLLLQVSAFAPMLMDVRGRLPARALASTPDLQVAYQVAPFAPAQVEPGRPRVLVLQRPAPEAHPDWPRWIGELSAQGWVVVLELDDHPALIRELVRLEVPPASSAPAAYGPLAWVHAVQTSTEALAQDFRHNNPEVAVFPNAVFELGAPPEASRPRRVFYGALSRGFEAQRAAASLAPFTREFPEAEFVVVGDCEVYKALPTRAKTLHPLMSYEAYLAELSRCVVSLSPLADGPWRHAKSDAKYLDAARSGVVTIASPTVYGDTIVDGKTGFIARDLGDWSMLLLRLFQDPELLSRVGRAAWSNVRDHRMFAAQAPGRRAWYFDLWSRRAELEAARQARLRA